MPIKKTKKRTVASQAAARGPLPALPEGLVDQLVKGPMTPDTGKPGSSAATAGLGAGMAACVIGATPASRPLTHSATAGKDSRHDMAKNVERAHLLKAIIGTSPLCLSANVNGIYDVFVICSTQ